MKIKNGKLEHTFAIEDDKKYVVFVSYPNDVSPDPKKMKQLIEIIDEWWKSDQKFMLIYENDGMKVKFERVDDGEEEKI